MKAMLKVLCVGLLLWVGVDARADWKADWEATVAAAAKEGQLNFYGNHAYPGVLKEFARRYPAIKVREVLGTAAQLSNRILSERRAGQYLADVYAASPRTAYTLLLPAKALDPLRPVFLLPEVVDEGHWFQGKHHFVDPEGQYVFVLVGTVEGAGVAYNTQQLNPGEISSYWDFLKPSWKGKIVSLDPQVGASSTTGLAFLYHNPNLGPHFIKRLYGGMGVTLIRDEVQLLNMVAAGKYALGFFVAEAENAAGKGLPVKPFAPAGFQEGAGVGPTGRGGLALMNRGPHPHATKVFINWLLSREGQTVFQTVLRVWRIDSMREDVPKEEIVPDFRRVKGAKYILTYRPEYADVTAARRIVREALEQRPGG